MRDVVRCRYAYGCKGSTLCLTYPVFDIPWTERLWVADVDIFLKFLPRVGKILISGKKRGGCFSLYAGFKVAYLSRLNIRRRIFPDRSLIDVRPVLLIILVSEAYCDEGLRSIDVGGSIIVFWSKTLRLVHEI